MIEQKAAAKPATPRKQDAPRVIPEKKWLIDMERNSEKSPFDWRPVVLQRFFERPVASNPSRMSWLRKLN